MLFVSEKTAIVMNDDEIKLREYEIAFQSAKLKDDLVWKTYSAIGAISVAPLVLLGIFAPDISWELTTYVASFVVFLSLIWWNMSQRWWDIQQVNYLRMRHIEEDIGMYLTRYVESIQGSVPLKKNNHLNKDRIASVRFSWRFSLHGVQKPLYWFIPGTTLIWLAVVVLKATKDSLQIPRARYLWSLLMSPQNAITTFFSACLLLCLLSIL